MANQPTSDIYSGKFSVPFFDFAGLVAMSRSTLTETAKQNSKLNTTLQAVGNEWTDFVGARLREDSELLRTLLECKELPSMQRAYVQFSHKADFLDRVMPVNPRRPDTSVSFYPES
jgi:hypothetical protein